MNERDLLKCEKDVFGFYLTGDPFKEVAPLGRAFATASLTEVPKTGDGKLLRVAGLVTWFKKHSTKKGDTMAFLTIEADGVSIDITLFPKIYRESSHMLIVDEPLFLVIRTQDVNGVIKVNAEKLLTIDDLNSDGFASGNLNIPMNLCRKDTYEKLMNVFRQFPGTVPFVLQVTTPESEVVTITPPSNLKISLSPGLLNKIEQICGKGTFSLAFPELDALRERNVRGYSKNFANG